MGELERRQTNELGRYAHEGPTKVRVNERNGEFEMRSGESTSLQKAECEIVLKAERGDESKARTPNAQRLHG